MRIEQDNNLTFKAYFKPNMLFKQIYNHEAPFINEELIDKFVKECPDHEVEILDPMPKKLFNYILFNNTTGKYLPVIVRNARNVINTLIEACINEKEDPYGSVKFWRDDIRTINYQKLTGTLK